MNPTTNGSPVQFPVTKKHFAVCHDPKCVASRLIFYNSDTSAQNISYLNFLVICSSGPIFGAGADLYISSMCGSNSDSYTNLPHSYEIKPGGDPGGSGLSRKGVSDSPGSRSTTPSSTSSPTTGIEPSAQPPPPGIKRGGRHKSHDKLVGEESSGCGPLLAPSYNFVVSDYEVFIPIN